VSTNTEGAIRRIAIAACSLISLVPLAAAGQQQVVDPDFKTVVEKPAYRTNGPTVAIDESHNNFHTAGGQYKPFAELLTSDGYHVVPLTRRFEKGSLAGIDVLVIANANARNLTDSVFTEDECDVVRDWVQAGGALLLIADHAPYGTSTANLAERFGVTMGKGWVFEPTATSLTTQLVFSRENGKLGVHPILSGRDASEDVKVVKSFTGQSLGVPNGATVLLKLTDGAREAADTSALDAEAAARAAGASTDVAAAAGTKSTSVAGRAQGLAMTSGKGRVVVLGEAAMLSAQVITLPDRTFKVGMNTPGNDNRQFALNVMHWLSGALR